MISQPPFFRIFGLEIIPFSSSSTLKSQSQSHRHVFFLTPINSARAFRVSLLDRSNPDQNNPHPHIFLSLLLLKKIISHY
jgi:hypothetical protein